MHGYKNRILRVNLTQRSFSEQSLDEDLVLNYVGGRGFGAKLLYDNVTPNVDPLDEENVIIFLAGPLADTNAQSFDRWKVFFKSPLTGGYFTSSGGGHFASELKKSGFDAVIVTGKADSPLYLLINNGNYELRDATYLWGLNCDDTHTLIREEIRNPKIRMACIGPAGENGVKYAGIFSDRRTAGRGGGGAVMGAKNLKAIAVRGDQKPDLADPDAFRAAVKAQIATYKAAPACAAFSKTGTQTAEFTHLLGIYPTRNFRGGIMPDMENLDTEAFNKIRVRNIGCGSCMVHCGSLAKINDGAYRGAWTEGPEYETIWSFSGSILCSDQGLIVAADNLCDKLGMDSITTGVAIGFAYELYEKGIITKEDTDDMELVYGDGKPVLRLIEMIAQRDGIGDILAEGTRKAAQKIGKGSDQYAIHVKGLELPAYDPRGAKAHGLNYLTQNFGADHCSGYAGQEIFGAPFKGEVVDRFSTEKKGEITKWNQDRNVIWNLGIICGFPSGYINFQIYGDLLSSLTGRKEFADEDYLWRVGERVFNLERMFNVREGFGRKDDVFPKRIVSEPMEDGPSAGQIFEEETLLNDYYKARDWNPETGAPTPEKLKSLSLEFTMTG